MTDDLGYGEVNHNGTFGFPTNALAAQLKPFQRPAGLTIMRTPQLARMASQGLRAVMSYSPSAICAPSRAAIFLERHVGVVDCIRGNKVAVNNELVPLSDESSLSFVQELQLAGYRTGYFGKWGLGVVQGAPWRHGFDTYAGQLYHIEAHTYFPGWYYSFAPGDVPPNTVSELNRLKIAIPVNANNTWSDRNCALAPEANKRCVDINDVTTDRALAFIRESRLADQPFFAFLAPIYPHAGKYNSNDPESVRIAPAKRISPWRLAQKPSIMRGHASQIEQSMDGDVGRVLDMLEADPELDRNTLFIFTSDNGANQEKPFHKTIYQPTNGLRGAKRNLFEGGIRVPTILRWPGVLAAGGVTQVPFVMYDLGPTVREIAGLRPAPTEMSQGKPTLSVSMLGAWRYGTPVKRDFMQFEMCDAPGADLLCKTAIIDLRNIYNGQQVWKLQQFPGTTQRKELYDIRKSPRERGEIKNAAKKGELHQARNRNRTPFANTCVFPPP